MARGKVSEEGIEAFYTDPNAAARTSTYGVEVFYSWTAASPTTVTGAGVTEYGVEAFYTDPGAPLFISEYGVEVFYVELGDVEAVASGVHVFGHAS